ncbi:MAG: hypothetical protein AAGD38_19710 [Acidobacteriota bacterium]
MLARTFTLLVLLATAATAQTTHYVATTGNNTTGNGTVGNPWATIEFAVDQVSDGDLILVQPGDYVGRVRFDRTFAQGITIRSAMPYQARLRNNDRVITVYSGQGITVEGFDIAHSGPGSAPLVIHVQDLIGPPGGTDFVSRITFRNNVIHDSWDNDLLKINNGAGDVLVEGNLFYNQSGSDEHIDVNSVTDVEIRDNVFFNDFAGSSRPNNNDTSGFIVVKDSNADDDSNLGSLRVDIRRNVFLHWEGSPGSNFVLIGEDGQPFYEAIDVLVENNLMLGDSGNDMRAAFGVKGAQSIVFRHNTVSGDLPAAAFAMRLNREGANLQNDDIHFWGNVWSDATGTMGIPTGGGPLDFSDTPPADTTANWSLDTNVYWNGGAALPFQAGELINPSDDPNPTVGDPVLTSPAGAVLPRWDPVGNLFVDGSTSIHEVFVNLVQTYGRPGSGSVVSGVADPANAPVDDILGRPRPMTGIDAGAYQESILFADGFESGDTSSWSVTVP